MIFLQFTHLSEEHSIIMGYILMTECTCLEDNCRGASKKVGINHLPLSNENNICNNQTLLTDNFLLNCPPKMVQEIYNFCINSCFDTDLSAALNRSVHVPDPGECTNVLKAVIMSIERGVSAIALTKKSQLIQNLMKFTLSMCMCR